MSKVHALETGPNGTRTVYHVAPPAGNNSAGFSWVAAGLASGDLGHTVLTVGTGPGQTTQAEVDALLAGTIVELEDLVPAESGGTTTAQQSKTFDDGVAARRRDWLATFRAKLKWFGYAQA
jgi:hypothetical protein